MLSSEILLAKSAYVIDTHVCSGFEPYSYSTEICEVQLDVIQLFCCSIDSINKIEQQQRIVRQGRIL